MSSKNLDYYHSITDTEKMPLEQARKLDDYLIGVFAARVPYAEWTDAVDMALKILKHEI